MTTASPSPRKSEPTANESDASFYRQLDAAANRRGQSCCSLTTLSGVFLLTLTVGLWLVIRGGR
jgi:hypothetical protein